MRGDLFTDRYRSCIRAKNSKNGLLLCLKHFFYHICKEFDRDIVVVLTPGDHVIQRFTNWNRNDGAVFRQVDGTVKSRNTESCLYGKNDRLQVGKDCKIKRGYAVICQNLGCLCNRSGYVRTGGNEEAFPFDPGQIEIRFF